MRAFDTYTHINELKEAGFNEKQAAVIIKSLVESRETDISHLATREQVNELKNDVKEQMNELKNDVKEQMNEFKNDVKEQMNEFKIDIKEQMNEFKIDVKEQMSELKTDVALIKEQIKSFVTKEDLKDVQINLIKWMVGTMIAFSGVMLAGIKLL